MRRKILMILSLFGLNLLIFCFLAVGHSWGAENDKIKRKFIELKANLQAQQQKKFYRNKAFLIQQGELFQKWLQDNTKLSSEAIKLEKIEYRKEFTVQERKHPEESFPRIYNLYLKGDVNYCVYRQTEAMMTPEKLFFKFIQLLEIPPEFAKLTIKNECVEYEFPRVANKNGELYTLPLREPLIKPAPKAAMVKINEERAPTLEAVMVEDIFINEQFKKIENVRGINPDDAGTHTRTITTVGKNPQLLAAPELITNFFKKYYSQKGGKVRVTVSNTRFIDVSVKSLRNEVIQESNYWENLQFSLFIFYKDNSLVDIGCVLDGQYAGGLGKLPPAEESFSDMGGQELRAYLGELLVNLQKYLATGNF